MINAEKMSHVLEAYRKAFSTPDPENDNKTGWQKEQYKWIAVKHFQKHWNIDALDFVAMLKESMSKTYNLLASRNYLPLGMILEFARVDTNAVREMFRELFDESKSVVDRVNHFIENSEKIRTKYGNDSWKSHYQNVNSVSTYLWLRYPDKYYIYKYSECRQAASALESDFSVKKGAKADALLDFINFYDEIAEYIKKEPSTCEMLKNALTDDCYEDPQYRTLTIDVGFFISRYYVKPSEKSDDNNEATYWPTEEQYSISISKDEWKKYIEEVEFPKHKGCMGMLKALLELNGEASCKKLSSIYGGNPTRYVGSAVNIGRRAKKYFNLPPCMDGNVERFFAIPFLGRLVSEDGSEFYSYKIREELHEALKEIDLSSIDPYVGNEEDAEGYWWLNANPKIWSFSDIPVNAEQTYTLYNENGNKRRIFQNFLDAKAGDIVIGYESTPVKQVVAIAEISKEHDDNEICFKKVEGLTTPIDYQTLRECPELENMEYFAQPQGSLFRLTKEEFNCIMDIIREFNPAPIRQEEHKKYTKTDFLNEVFMSEDSYDALVALLNNKKNIILQGAPGVGKTFAAKRLAYSMMGEIDDSRVEFVQFHQNYSYEDFMMGYKPTDTGFELKYGIFYRFCQVAANHPDQEYFFVIDEINRGNMSKIFGELLMLIEKDYRGKKATLTYNGRSFSVPENLYIIGMMNTADRSLAMIDYALRRRFSFYNMEPGFATAGFKAYQAAVNNDHFNKLVDEVVNLNKAIANDKSLGSGFCIGHSYFLGKPEDGIDAWVRSIVQYDLIPMLQEYWFDDADNVKKWSDLLSGAVNG